MNDPTITPKQRWTLLQLWSRLCADRSWKTSDRALRLETFSQILGRQVESTNDIRRIDECTKLMHGLKSLLGVSLQAGMEANDPGINRCRILIHHIGAELVPCLELYIHDVNAYLVDIMADKNRWWKLDRPSRQIRFSDLNENQLTQLRDTLNARLHTHRRAADHTIHEMKLKAGVPCSCAICKNIRAREQASSPHPSAVNFDDPPNPSDSFDETTSIASVP